MISTKLAILEQMSIYFISSLISYSFSSLILASHLFYLFFIFLFAKWYAYFFSFLGSELVTALREILTLGIFVYSILSCVMMLLRIAQVIYPQWHCKILACVYNLLYLNSYSKTFLILWIISHCTWDYVYYVHNSYQIQ